MARSLHRSALLAATVVVLGFLVPAVAHAHCAPPQLTVSPTTAGPGAVITFTAAGCIEMGDSEDPTEPVPWTLTVGGRSVASGTATEAFSISGSFPMPDFGESQTVMVELLAFDQTDSAGINFVAPTPAAEPPQSDATGSKGSAGSKGKAGRGDSDAEAQTAPPSAAPHAVPTSSVPAAHAGARTGGRGVSSKERVVDHSAQQTAHGRGGVASPQPFRVRRPIVRTATPRSEGVPVGLGVLALLLIAVGLSAWGRRTLLARPGVRMPAAESRRAADAEIEAELQEIIAEERVREAEAEEPVG